LACPAMPSRLQAEATERGSPCAPTFPEPGEREFSSRVERDIIPPQRVEEAARAFMERRYQLTSGRSTSRLWRQDPSPWKNLSVQRPSKRKSKRKYSGDENSRGCILRGARLLWRCWQIPIKRHCRRMAGQYWLILFNKTFHFNDINIIYCLATLQARGPRSGHRESVHALRPSYGQVRALQKGHPSAYRGA